MDNSTALRRWWLAQRSVKGHHDHHHEQQPGVQTNFRKDVKSLIAVTEELGNPFEDKSGTHCA